ncbi:pepC1N protein [Latilactobacillus sakei subsp. carnosus DSM 15831]|uniref:aminopeptidase C n=1 Tax=Latilactobacillus sakei TaxID=1599 RepID=UPI00019CF452|nr:C1 family peptidase [Latilactobacillus sakei]KRL71063.1 pepC1N protein [Latilactobacillus sakei subsp. carnosus DSM 15831]GEP21279.1 aminopeptidase C [Latilactobacillus sakei subsp. carnosus]
MTQEITHANLIKMRQALADMPQAQTLRSAVMNNGINAVAQRPDAAVTLDPTYSIDLPTGDVSFQKKSGRCWLFATLNTLRHDFEQQYNVKNFELSQNYLSFWDRIEKANLFYEKILATATKPITDREVAFALAGPDFDGGQWDNAVALIQKYGAVPKSVMPETYNSDLTTEFNSTLNLKLRTDAIKLRQLVANQAPSDKISETRTAMLSEIYRLSVYAFGEPVETFDFAYRDNDQQYHLDQGLTPLSFYQKYLNRNFDDYVTVVSSPQASKQYNQLYSLDSQDTVVEGHPMRLLNLPPDRLKALAIQSLKAGEPIWFGNDVLADLDRQKGWLDSNLYDYSSLFSIDLTMPKDQRLDYRQGVVSHAMTLTGVNLVDDQPTKWKVENTWSDKVGNKGYFSMSDAWFDDYVYEVVIKKEYLTKEEQALLDQTPIKLDPWDALQ